MKNPRPKDETCETCVYWYREDEEREENGETQCRRDPPTIFDDGTSNWPPTFANDWCGHHNDDWHNRYRKDLSEEEPHHGLARAGMK